MKNTFIITSSVIGSVALLFVLDICYWHIFGLHFYKTPYLPGALFWLGLLFTALATAFAAWSVRGHWRSGRLLGQLVWCCTLLGSYSALFVYAASHPLL
jgi:hypothetical protein